ncbi:pyridoxal phosphate-dependent aminotransferase [Labrenzia sp. R4_1]|uniref:pyridoxal phosphate-dependent aminotransferase n=1 Tax=Labrenzia sp. R4_1 TaxID=2821106 RepID=UPI00256FEFBB|nr:pyridoxal phosphate-dependent aminotransferase [Labrenzia sp. R4_1]
MTALIDTLSHEARMAPESGIVEVFNAGQGRDDVIPLWAGEGDLPTPQFICDAAKQSLDNGETFYTYQRGIPELRTALAGYHQRVFGKAFAPERFFVTGSGMQSIQLAIQAIASSGEEVLVPTPTWPNIEAALGIRGVKPVSVPMREVPEGWELDVDDLEASITPKTAAIFLNSPSNPTGWVASEEVLRQVLGLARKHGLWIIADEIYALFYYGTANRAPSFYDIADEDDQIIYVNSMSKNWAMTGWRIGWISAPEALGQVLENLIQYSTSGVPMFSQRAAVSALNDGHTFLEQQVALAKEGRDCVVQGLGALNRVRIAAPQGAFYLFFSIDGVEDTRKFAMDCVRETGVGLAPGTAFGNGGENYIRLCFARQRAHLEEAIQRISVWLPEI